MPVPSYESILRMLRAVVSLDARIIHPLFAVPSMIDWMSEMSPAPSNDFTPVVVLTATESTALPNCAPAVVQFVPLQTRSFHVTPA